MADNHICNCGKKLSSYHSLWRHRKICKKNKTPASIIKTSDKADILGDILNKVSHRAKMDVKPMTTKTSKESMNEVIPSAAFNSDDVKKKTKFDLSDSERDSNQSEMETDSESSDDVEFMPDNPEDLKKCFRQLFYKLHGNIDIYNKLVCILDELERMNCLTKEECNYMNKHLQEKMNI